VKQKLDADISPPKAAVLFEKVLLIIFKNPVEHSIAPPELTALFDSNIQFSSVIEAARYILGISPRRTFPLMIRLDNAGITLEEK
jgi:hypothetical protein